MTNKTLYTLLGLLIALLALATGAWLSTTHFDITHADNTNTVKQPSTNAPANTSTQSVSWLDTAYPLVTTDSPKVAERPSSLKPREHLKNGLIVNFWGTWCPPCVKELPLLNNNQAALLGKAQPFTPVLALAIDKPEAVQRFLGKHPLPNLTVAVAGLEGLSILKEVGNNTGQLPYTIVLDSTGAIVHKHLGELDAQQIIQLQNFVQSHTK